MSLFCFILDPQRIVLLGKSGSGKSSLANTIFGQNTFTVNHGSDSKTKESVAQTKMVNRMNLTLIDTPGMFNADRTKDEVESEIYSCFIECAPGPHAFLFVLLVEKFTEQEQAIVDQIKQTFGEDVFSYTTVVFTHGDQLQEGMEIMDFVSQSKGLRELIQKCGKRCHVIDNKYWKNSHDPYRSNSVQVQKILDSIQMTLTKNNGRFLTNEMLKRVEEEITSEQNRIQETQGLSREESRELAKKSVYQKFIKIQKRKRYVKYFVMVGVPLGILILIGCKMFSSFWVKAMSDHPTGVDEAHSLVMEVVQDTVAPIKSFLEYVIKTIYFGTGKSTETTLPNKTHAEF